MRKLNGREQTLLLAFLNVLIVVLIWNFIQKPLESQNVNLASEISEKETQLEATKIELELINQSAVQLKAEQAKIAEIQQSILLYAETEEVHAFVNKLASKHNLQIQNISLTESADPDESVIVTTSVDLAVNGTYDNLEQFIKNLESYEKMINVSSLDLGEISPDSLNSTGDVVLSSNIRVDFHMSTTDRYDESDIFMYYRF